MEYTYTVFYTYTRSSGFGYGYCDIIRISKISGSKDIKLICKALEDTGLKNVILTNYKLIKKRK